MGKMRTDTASQRQVAAGSGYGATTFGAGAAAPQIQYLQQNPSNAPSPAQPPSYTPGQPQQPPPQQYQAPHMMEAAGMHYLQQSPPPQSMQMLFASHHPPTQQQHGPAPWR